MAQEKLVLVTGAGRGIGRATSVLLAKEGFTPLMTARTRKQLLAVESEILSAGGKCKFLVADLSKKNSVPKLFLKIKNLIAVVNNAGACYQEDLEKINMKKWDEMVTVNLSSVLEIISLAFKKLKKNGGVIVNIASVAGVYGVSKYKGLGPYAATKAGVIALTEMVAQEGKEKKIFGYCISPGAVDTQMLRTLVSESFIPDLKPVDIAQRIVSLIKNKPAPLNGKNIQIWGK